MVVILAIRKNGNVQGVIDDTMSLCQFKTIRGARAFTETIKKSLRDSIQRFRFVGITEEEK
jgi:hypothetical protein